MTNAELLAKIKAEIERLKFNYAKRGYTIVISALKHLQDFLSPFEAEEPMNQKGLEREIERCLWKLSDDPSNEELRMFARHFAEWGAEHAKKDEIPVPSDLEEAAEEYSKERAEGHILYDWVHAFIAGAKWQKEQDTREMIMSDGSYFQKCYELGKKDILSKFTKEHLEGLKWIERAGISTQPVPYHKYCKDLYKVLEEILKEKYDTQGDTSI